MVLRGPHIRLIAAHHVKHSLRGGAGLVFVFMALVVGLLCAQVVLGSAEMLHVDNPEQALTLGTKALSWALSPSPAQLEFLSVDHPVLISALLAVLLVFIPFLITLGGFNQTSGDISSKGLRYLLQRTERSNIFFGRLIGSYVFTLIVLFILFMVIALYVVAKVKVHPAGDMIMWLLGGYWRVAILALPYMALCAWISAGIDSPFGSLVVVNIFVLFIPLLGLIARTINPAVGEAVGYVMPGGYKWWLLDPGSGKLLGSIVIMLGFTAIFAFFGYRHFEKRDL
jgi:ABC-type transport system involved in multi-copper enzyme maturation permease subunit